MYTRPRQYKLKLYNDGTVQKYIMTSSSLNQPHCAAIGSFPARDSCSASCNFIYTPKLAVTIVVYT